MMEHKENPEVSLETKTRREQVLLGCALAFPKRCLEPLLRADEALFVDTNHKSIFQTLKSLYEQNIPVDAITVKGRLDGKVEISYLLSLQESIISPEVSNFEYHLNQLVPPVMPEDFLEVAGEDIIKILGLTIKLDDSNKLITFLAMLSAFTENDQFNLSFNAPSSTGKSYIPLETGRLFPQEDTITIGYCSPTAFFHDHSAYDKEKGTFTVDLHRKILIFLDQPHTLLLQHLRPLLSHDKKELIVKITDKNQKYGLRTKNIIIVGWPSVIFCTAGLNIDEQETTRFLLLSPDTNQEKIRESIYERIKKATDQQLYQSELEGNIPRQQLIHRIKAIQKERIKEIQLDSPEKVREVFNKKALKPRHMRDVGRLMSLIKAFALLNLWHRERTGFIIKTSERDLQEALKLWDAISECQELNLPPYVFRLYKDVIKPACDKKPEGLTRQALMTMHYEVYQRFLSERQLSREILPMLEAAGLIISEADSMDKRKVVIRCVQ